MHFLNLVFCSLSPWHFDPLHFLDFFRLRFRLPLVFLFDVCFLFVPGLDRIPLICCFLPKSNPVPPTIRDLHNSDFEVITVSVILYFGKQKRLKQKNSSRIIEFAISQSGGGGTFFQLLYWVSEARCPVPTSYPNTCPLTEQECLNDLRTKLWNKQINAATQCNNRRMTERIHIPERTRFMYRFSFSFLKKSW